MNNTFSFVAIDFETMTPAHTSACSIGLVKVENNFITRKFYSLIKPIPDDYNNNNSIINGITREMTATAPTFQELFLTIKNFIGDSIILCHQYTADIYILEACMKHYNLSGINTSNYICTYTLFQKSLKECCYDFGITISSHHDALADAEACALCFLRYKGILSAGNTGNSIKDIMRNPASRHYEKQTLKAPTADQIINKDTIFYLSSTVITGTFENFPERNELGRLLQSLGADINTAISKKTNIVIIGSGAGPSKLKKIQDLKEGGYNIKLIYEPELIDILRSINKYNR